MPESRPSATSLPQVLLRRMPASSDPSVLGPSSGYEQHQSDESRILNSNNHAIGRPATSTVISSVGVESSRGNSSISSGERSRWSHLGSNSQSGTSPSGSGQSGCLVPPESTKRPQKRLDPDVIVTETDSDGQDDKPVGMGNPGQRPGKPRLPGACSHCKRLKMKCVFESGADICQRCQHANKTCIVESRRVTTPVSNKYELLRRELASKDQLIDSLLRQIHNPAMRAPIDWPPSVLVSHPTNAQNNPLDKDVFAWIESMRLNRPPTPIGPTVSNTSRQCAYLEFLPAQPQPDDDAVSFSESAPKIKYKSDERLQTPAELRQDSADLDDKLHSIPPSAAPVGLIAKLALTEKRGSDAGMTGDAEEEDRWVGIGNATYFEAGPSADLELRRIIIERQMPPEILTHGVIKPAEVELLFKIFFEQLNPFMMLLDPHMHTPAFVFGRCPFLFTAICAISSRYYTERPELYALAMHFAKESASATIFDRWKTVEVVQAYIMMSMYPVPARRWEEDRAWMYLGSAIRMATDLNLHIPWQGESSGEAHEREILNRTRTWLICFNLDQSGATLFGRPPTLREDYIVQKSQGWYKSSNFNLALDVHLTAYTRLLRIVARFLAQVCSDSSTPTALNKNLDFLLLCNNADKELIEYEHETKEQFEKESDHNDSACEYWCHLLPLLSNYSRLVIYSFGHQQAFQRGLDQGKIFFDKCYNAASKVVSIAIDVLAPSGRLKYAPDEHFVFLSFAAAFLLKMLHPLYAAACEPAQSTHIIQLVSRLIEVLASNEVAIDDRHTPRLYSRFLSRLIAKHTQGSTLLTKPGATTPAPLPAEEISQQGRVGSPVARMRSPPIVIRSPTIDQSMHDVGQNESASPQVTHGRSPSGDQPSAAGSYVTVNPSGDMSSMASTTQGETTITDASNVDMEYANDEHDMLAAMHAIEDPKWWNSSLLPGFNTNFAADGSNLSNEMQNWYVGQANLAAGAASGGSMGGMDMQMINNVPNLFAPGPAFTQAVDMNQEGPGVDHLMTGYGHQSEDGNPSTGAEDGDSRGV